MSRPLFFTSMTRPEMMLSAAISTTIERMMNITRRSVSSAERKAPEASRQVQSSARGPAAAASAGSSSSTRSGSLDHHLDLVGAALAVEEALRLVEGHVDAGLVDVVAADAEDVDDRVVVDPRLGAEGRVHALRRDQRDDVADADAEVARDAAADGDAVAELRRGRRRRSRGARPAAPPRGRRAGCR